jgi:hypothetical protein
MRNLALKCKKEINQRALSTIIEVRGRLIGSSSMWIFTRGKGNKVEARKPIFYIKK